MQMGAGPEQQPMNWIGDWVGKWAAMRPNRPALCDADTDTVYTYGELNRRANQVARWMTDAGLQPGDVVGLICRNRVEAVDIYLACGKLGVILAPLSYRLRPRELNELIQRIQPKALFQEDVFDALVEDLTIPGEVRRIRIADQDSDYHAQLLHGDAPEMNRPLSMQQTFLYIHTGGTTATPKVCIVPYRQMVWNSIDLVFSGGMPGEARLIITFPFFHIGGWNSFTPVLHTGGFAVLMRQFDPGQLLELIPRHRITHFGGVEAMFRFLLAHPAFERTDLSSLQGITSAGAPCAEPGMEAFIKRGIPITQAYGLTEAGPSNFIYSPLDAPLDEVWRHNRSIGTSMMHCDYRIVDQDTLEPVPRGETGVLCMRSMHNFGGYLGDPERTRKALLDDGWVWSGDLAREDDEGFVYIVGRADNMFISGGENVSPEEIENVLNQHPAVVQVGVVPLPDERWGQVAAAVVVAPGADEGLVEELMAHCRRELAGFKVPKHNRLSDELPMTGAGKLNRGALAAEFGERGA
ncbi:MAG: AMP-binding protein [Ectothiorhodospiraceae bacterium]|nr:AMP-binding protein [Ectothiorhodospiraceae bacterium]